MYACYSVGMKHSKTVLLAGGIVVITLLSGCAISQNIPSMQNHNMMSESQGAFSDRDIMFAQMMIPHHQQALDMSALAFTQSTNPEVLLLAEKIYNAQEPEIRQMQSWLDAQDADSHMGHSMEDMGMSGMGGMLTEEEMSVLSGLSGAEFDKSFLEAMIEHHEGAIQMTQMIADSSNPEVAELAQAIIESQTAEIAQMKELLGRIS